MRPRTVLPSVIEPTNKYRMSLDLHLPDGEPDERAVEQWLNTQWTGKPKIAPDDQVSPEHKDAAYALHRHRRVTVEVTVDKFGNKEITRLL